MTEIDKKALLEALLKDADPSILDKLKSMKEDADAKAALQKAEQEIVDFLNAPGEYEGDFLDNVAAFAKDLGGTLSFKYTVVVTDDGVTFSADAIKNKVRKTRTASEPGAVKDISEADDKDKAAAAALRSGKNYDDAADAAKLKLGTLKGRIKKYGGIDTYKTIK